MTERRIAIIIEADGKASVAAINETTGAVEKLEDATQKLGEETERASKKGEGSAKRWKDAGAVIGQAIGGAAVALVTMIGLSARMADATEDVANRLGTTTEFISEMGYATKMAAGDSTFLEAALARLTVNAAKAEQGAKSQGAVFRSLGIDVRTTEGYVKSLDQLLPELARKFKQMPDGPRETAVAVALFGKEGRKMVPLLNQGAEGIQKLREEAISLGKSISGETAAAAGQFNDNLDRLRAAGEGLATTVMADTVPALSALSGQLVKDAQAVTQSGQQYSALGLIVKTLGSVYYAVQAVVESGTYRILVAVDTVQQVVTTAGRNVALFYRGALEGMQALARGDYFGAINTFVSTVTTGVDNSRRALGQIASDWASESQLVEQSFVDFNQKIFDLWNPTMAEATKTMGATGTAADDLGDGFLGAGRKAADGADKAQKAMQKLRELVRDLQAETASEVTKTELENTDNLERIAQLERETAVLGPLAERTQLLAEARTAAAESHARALRVAQLADAEREREKDIVAARWTTYGKRSSCSGCRTVSARSRRCCCVPQPRRASSTRRGCVIRQTSARKRSLGCGRCRMN